MYKMVERWWRDGAEIVQRWYREIKRGDNTTHVRKRDISPITSHHMQYVE
jgi:hypothetical protein